MLQERNLVSINTHKNHLFRNGTVNLKNRDFIMVFSATYRIQDTANLYYYINLIETETYQINYPPNIKLECATSNPVYTNWANASVFKLPPNYISDNIVFKSSSEVTRLNQGECINLLNPGPFTLSAETVFNRKKRRSFINAIYQYGNYCGNHFYIFGNSSPSYSNRRLVSTEPYAAEYYNQAYLAEQKDKGMTFPQKIIYQPKLYNLNFGVGFSMGTGHSFFTSYTQYQKGYSIYVTKPDTGYNNKIIRNQGAFIGYRYQRIHRYKAIMPVVEASYGWISGPKNDVYKLAAGVSTMLWSKNLYLNVVPFYMGGFSSTDGITGIKGINPRMYNVGIDVGLVYKIWFF